jgi:hypothetical protein
MRSADNPTIQNHFCREFFKRQMRRHWRDIENFRQLTPIDISARPEKETQYSDLGVSVQNPVQWAMNSHVYVQSIVYMSIYLDIDYLKTGALSTETCLAGRQAL